ncbi:tumor necrosis factor receptor superfamily member 6 [Bombina bombina]|uniref:tumor necrosis factor receptor superfamily member 6 n=1 Tax=Bombina bombina TaxID=8345 RepID=UPI00235AB006|nr:tumor necrosis factor receptor superfamily member 6 [Bombina bombina]
MKLKPLLLLFLITIWKRVLSSESEHNPMNDRQLSSLKSFKQQSNCSENEYPAENHCCKTCPPGQYKVSDCPEEHGNPQCGPCTKGKDYMDYPNGYSECLKCSHCDSVRGEAVLIDCTPVQDTLCKCIEGYFCNKTKAFPGHCIECLPCDRCEHGIVENCTDRKNTVCKVTSYRTFRIIIILSALLFVVALILSLRFIFKANQRKNTQDTKKPTDEETPLLVIPQELEDIDLKDVLLQEIANELTLQTVISCVLKLGVSDVRIDEIKNNNPGNAQEQKRALLKDWYSSNGRSGAFKRLMETLQKIGNKAEAERIIQQLVK